jgi:hypothetical protein
MGPANKGGLSKRQIKDASSVSDGLLGEMRRVHGKLGASAADYGDWWTAMKAAKGEDVGTWSDEDRDNWEQQRADDLTDKLRKAWGPPPGNARLTAMVLEAYLGDRIRDLAEELRDFLEDTKKAASLDTEAF